MENQDGMGSMRIDKVCPIIIRIKADVAEILVFQHPHAGVQLVKGGLEVGETCAQAAARELAEESGLIATSKEHLGNWRSGRKREIWSFHLMDINTNELPDAWGFFTQDGGGKTFEFYWHPLHLPATESWNVVYARAVVWVREQLAFILSRQN